MKDIRSYQRKVIQGIHQYDSNVDMLNEFIDGHPIGKICLKAHCEWYTLKQQLCPAAWIETTSRTVPHCIIEEM